MAKIIILVYVLLGLIVALAYHRIIVRLLEEKDSTVHENDKNLVHVLFVIGTILIWPYFLRDLYYDRWPTKKGGGTDV